MQAPDFKTIRNLIAADQTEAAQDVFAELLSKNTSDTDFRDECLKIQAQQFRLLNSYDE